MSGGAMEIAKAQRSLWELDHKIEKVREGISQCQKRSDAMEGMQAAGGSGGRSKSFVSKAFTAAEAAKEIGVKESTFLRWLRRYDLLPDEHSITSFTEEEVLYIMLKTKDHPFATKEGKKVKTIDTSQVKLKTAVRARKAARSGKVASTPSQGLWTPTKGEKKGFLKAVGTKNREKAYEGLARGLVSSKTAGRVLKYNPTAINSWVRRGHLKAEMSFGRCSLFRVDALQKVADRMSGKISKTHPGQLDMFDKAPPPVEKPSPYSLPDCPPSPKGLRAATQEEIKRSLVHIPVSKKPAAEAMLQSGTYLTALLAGPMVGVHSTTIRGWFMGTRKTKEHVVSFGRLKLYPVEMIAKLADEFLGRKGPGGSPDTAEAMWWERGTDIGRLLRTTAKIEKAGIHTAERAADHKRCMNDIGEFVSGIVFGLAHGLGKLKV